jgi:hypothetical protein
MMRWSAFVPVLLGLCGCSSSPPVQLAHVSPHRIVTWAGPVRPSAVKRAQVKPFQPKAIDRSREAELAALPKHSPEWWSVHDAIEAEEDARLGKILVICRGCLDPTSVEHTGSINSQR